MSEWQDVEIRNMDLSDDMADITIRIDMDNLDGTYIHIKTQDIIYFLKMHRLI